MIRYILWFQIVMGYANPRAINALEYFENAENIFNASEIATEFNLSISFLVKILLLITLSESQFPSNPCSKCYFLMKASFDYTV